MKNFQPKWHFMLHELINSSSILRSSQCDYLCLSWPRAHVSLHYRLHCICSLHPANPPPPPDVHGLPDDRVKCAHLCVCVEHWSRIWPCPCEGCCSPLCAGKLCPVCRDTPVYSADPRTNHCFSAG